MVDAALCEFEFDTPALGSWRTPMPTHRYKAEDRTTTLRWLLIGGGYKTLAEKKIDASVKSLN